jgi:hypothetical protein
LKEKLYGKNKKTQPSTTGISLPTKRKTRIRKIKMMTEDQDSIGIHRNRP